MVGRLFVTSSCKARRTDGTVRPNIDASEQLARANSVEQRLVADSGARLTRNQ